MTAATSVARNAAGRATRLTILEAAERLFAERGIDAVPLAEILEAAGQRNKNAVHYHFGDKEALVAAIAERRSRALNERRSELLRQATERGHGADISVLTATLVTPLAELLNEPDNHFLGFLARHYVDRSRRALVASVDPGVTASYREAGRLIRSASGLKSEDFDIRFDLVLDMIFTGLARRQAEERFRSNRDLPRRELFVTNLIESAAGAFSSA